MKLIFIRHGDPDYVHDSLTAQGVIEAKLLADRIRTLEVKNFYCSPLGRAQETASYSLKPIHRDAITKDWLKEFSYPVKDLIQGGDRIPWDFMPAYWTNDSLMYDKDNWYQSDLLENGKLAAEYRNTCQGIDQVLSEHGYVRTDHYYRVTNGNTDTLVFFCHLGITCVILSHLLGIAPPVLWHGLFLAPTSVTTLCSEERIKGEAYFRCKVIGDTSHLLGHKEAVSDSGFFTETFQ